MRNENNLLNTLTLKRSVAPTADGVHCASRTASADGHANNTPAVYTLNLPRKAINTQCPARQTTAESLRGDTPGSIPITGTVPRSRIAAGTDSERSAPAAVPTREAPAALVVAG